MPNYIKLEEVRVRLIGKVKFTDDDADENKMQNALALRLINEAEGEVELDLSPRYAVPFVGSAGEAFAALPDRPTKETLRTLCELKACIRILETDFGSGTVVDASKYSESLQKRYEKILERLLAKKKYQGEDTNAWAYPPLLGLGLAPHNAEGDDGFMGQILTTSQGDGAFPRTQINDPSENFWNGALDDLG